MKLGSVCCVGLLDVGGIKTQMPKSIIRPPYIALALILQPIVYGIMTLIAFVIEFSPKIPSYFKLWKVNKKLIKRVLKRLFGNIVLLSLNS
jgi:hypothetical protein